MYGKNDGGVEQEVDDCSTGICKPTAENYGRPFVSQLFAYLAITVSRSIHSMFDPNRIKYRMNEVSETELRGIERQISSAYP